MTMSTNSRTSVPALFCFVLFLVGSLGSLAIAQNPMNKPDEPTPTGTPDKPKGKLPVMPALPAFEQLQRVQFPQQFKKAEDEPELTEPQILCKTFIELYAERHFTLGDWQKANEFRNKWMPLVKDVKNWDDADALNEKAMHSLGQRFDYYMKPADKAHEESISDPTIVGIGVSPTLRDMDELFDPLGDDAKAEDYEKVMVVSDEHPFVVTPFANSPAAKAGLWEGDIIREIDGKKIDGMKFKDVMGLIKGKEGTKVKLKVERRKGTKTLVEKMSDLIFTPSSSLEVPRVPEDGDVYTATIEITRGRFAAPAVHVRQLDDGSTYIKLDNFMANDAAKDMYTALTEVSRRANGRIILDLRNNGGGRLDHAINIVQYMLTEGTIVRLRQREGYNMVNIHYTIARDALMITQQAAWNPSNINFSAAQRVQAVREDVPIVVLINERTASASELTSGALQFHRRAKTVGVNSRGKGVGQAVVDLPGGRRTHVTTFFFDPAARIIDFEGVHPDVEKSLEPEMKKIEELQKKLREQLKKLNDANFALAQLPLAEEPVKVQLDNVALSLKANKAKLDEFPGKEKAATEKVTGLEKAVAENKAKLDKASTDAEKADLTKEKDKLGVELAAAVKAKAQLVEDKKTLDKEAGELEASKTKLDIENAKLLTEKTTHEAAVAAAEAELKTIRQSLRDVRKLLRDNDPQLQEAKKLVITEGERLKKEAQDAKVKRDKAVEKKTKEWELERKRQEEDAMKKKAAA